MAAGANPYSRLVAWLKVLLPLTALALLSTLFLFSRRIDPNQSIPYAEVDVPALLREPRVTSPSFAGVTEEGTAITVAAEMVQFGETGSGSASAEGMVARVEAVDGTKLLAAADTGTIVANTTARLAGDVRIETTNGYRIATQEVVTRLDRTEVSTNGPIRAQGPLGEVTAGTLDVTADDKGGLVLVFHEGVKLVYTPQTEE